MNDNDLISRAAAISEINEYFQGLDSCISEPDLKLDGYRNGLQVAIQELKVLPAVDAVPVVRCEDCKYAEYPRMAAICSRFYGAGGHGFFCAAGVRRDDVTIRTAEQR